MAEPTHRLVKVVGGTRASGPFLLRLQELEQREQHDGGRERPIRLHARNGEPSHHGEDQCQDGDEWRLVRVISPPSLANGHDGAAGRGAAPS